MTAVSFPLGGTAYEMAIYFMVSLCWVIPVWFAAPKLGYSRWWAVATLLSLTVVILLLWRFSLPEGWNLNGETKDAVR